MAVLLASGRAGAECRNFVGQCALHLAVEAQNGAPVVEILLTARADVAAKVEPDVLWSSKPEVRIWKDDADRAGRELRGTAAVHIAADCGRADLAAAGGCLKSFSFGPRPVHP